MKWKQMAAGLLSAVVVASSIPTGGLGMASVQAADGIESVEDAAVEDEVYMSGTRTAYTAEVYENIALASKGTRIVEYTGVQNKDCGPNYINDGQSQSNNNAGRWHSKYPLKNGQSDTGNVNYIVLDLGDPGKRVKEFRVRWFNLAIATEYKIQTTTQDFAGDTERGDVSAASVGFSGRASDMPEEGWTNLLSVSARNQASVTSAAEFETNGVTINASGAHPQDVFRFEKPQKLGKYVRIAVTKMNHGAGINMPPITEFEIHGRDAFNFTATAGIVSGCENGGSVSVASADATEPSESGTSVIVEEDTSVMFTATPNDGYEFVGWYTDEQGIYRVEEAEDKHTMTIEADTLLYAKFVEQDADYEALHALIERAESVDENQYTEESRAALTEALDDAKAVEPGLKASSQETIDNAAAALEAALDALVREYTVTVTNGTIRGGKTRYLFGEQTQILAGAAPEGQKFAYWTANGKKVCYTPSYTFYVYDDMEMEACYVENEGAVMGEVSLACVSNFDMTTKKMKFTATRSLPDGYEVLEHGIIITDQTGWDTFASSSEGWDEAFRVGASRIKTAKGTSKALNGAYSATLSCTVRNTWYGRGYVKYRDADGAEQWAYSKVTTCIANVK